MPSAGVTLRPQYLRVRNWETFQHYKDRRPVWIKYLVASLDDYELTSLPPLTRLVYKELLLVAAITDNNIPHDPDWIASKVHLPRKTIAEAVETLLASGFLSLTDVKRSASKQIAKRRQEATPEKRQRQKTEKKEKEQKPRAVPLEVDAQPSIGNVIDISLKEGAA